MTRTRILAAATAAAPLAAFPAVGGPPADGRFALTVNANGGGDTVTITTAGLSSAVLSGGAGNDILQGGPGNDRIVGDPGADDMFGGAGNDVMVWNPGDGSDDMDGEAGADDAELNGGGNAESFKASPVGDRTRFERLSPGPFDLDVGPTTERLVLNANGGNDS